jgi:hypothetical protein
MQQHDVRPWQRQNIVSMTTMLLIYSIRKRAMMVQREKAAKQPNMHCMLWCIPNKT